MRGNLFRNRNSPETFLIEWPEEQSLSMVGQTECQNRTGGYVLFKPAVVGEETWP